MTKMNQFFQLPKVQLSCFTVLGKELEKFSIWTSLIGMTVTNLSGDYSFIWLRILIPIHDWRIDLKLCLDTWKLVILWTVDGHTWMMKALIIWQSPTGLALLVYRLLKTLSLYSGNSQIFAPLHRLIQNLIILQCYPLTLWFKFEAAWMRLETTLTVMFYTRLLGYVFKLPKVTIQGRAYSVGSSSNANPEEPDSGDKEDRAKRRARLLKGIFKPTSEKDTGQNTTNPYILALRHYKSDGALDLNILNSVLAYHKVSITQEEYDVIRGLVPVLLPFPLPKGDPLVYSTVGTSTKVKEKMVTGIYVLTNKEDGRQYVGRSSNLASRLRAYYGAKARTSSRGVDKLMTSLGAKAFKLEVYIIPFKEFEQFGEMTETYRSNITLAIEQYFILHLKPMLNDMLVVGGILTKFTEDTMELAHASGKIGTKEIYVYNADKTELLYVGKARNQVARDIGVSVKTMHKHMTRGTTLLNKFFFSAEPINERTESLMTANELQEAVKVLYLASSGPKHSVMLTDLQSPEQTVRHFRSKAKALRFTVSQGRPVGKTFMAKIPCTHNGWLVEVSNQEE